MRKVMVQEISDWQHRGLIDISTQERLSAPYQRPGQRLSTVLQWLGIGAVLFLGMGTLGAAGLGARSIATATLLFIIGGGGLWWGGVRLARHPDMHRPVTASVLLTLGLILLQTSFEMIQLSVSRHFRVSMPLDLLLSTILSLVTAYRYRLRWPLLLGLVYAFYGIGSRDEYLDSEDYDLNLLGPVAMAVIAGITALFGLWHQRAEEAQMRHVIGFGRLYIILGLLYFNSSLWFLSVDHYPSSESWLWIVLFTFGALGQLIIGACFQQPSFTGFGVVFLGIDLYTRFYEIAWDHLDASVFFMAVGASGILLGWIFERRALGARGYRT